MQIKKEEIADSILLQSENEFFIRGYNQSSLRTIAKKANISLSNIYSYFPHKREILAELLDDFSNEILSILSQHSNHPPSSPNSIVENVQTLEKYFDESNLSLLIDKRTVILMDLDSHEYFLKDSIYTALLNHFNCHVQLDSQKYTKIILDMIIECLRQSFVEFDDHTQAKQAFLDVFFIFSTGLKKIDSQKGK